MTKPLLTLIAHRNITRGMQQMKKYFKDIMKPMVECLQEIHESFLAITNKLKNAFDEIDYDAHGQWF